MLPCYKCSTQAQDHSYCPWKKNRRSVTHKLKLDPLPHSSAPFCERYFWKPVFFSWILFLWNSQIQHVLARIQRNTQLLFHIQWDFGFRFFQRPASLAAWQATFKSCGGFPNLFVPLYLWVRCSKKKRRLKKYPTGQANGLGTPDVAPWIRAGLTLKLMKPNSKLLCSPHPFVPAVRATRKLWN